MFQTGFWKIEIITFYYEIIKFFDKKIGSRATSKVKANVNEVLAQTLQKTAIKKFKRRKVYARLIKYLGSSGVKYLLFVIVVLTRYAWVKILKEKKTAKVFHGFLEIIGQEREFYNSPIQK